MAVKSMVPLGDRSLAEVLASVDADRTPMPNAGMKAISAICAQASGMMMAAAASHSGGLGNIVSGAPAMFPAAKQVSGANGAMLAGLGALAAASAAGKKEAAVKEAGKPRTKSKPGEPVKEGAKPATSTETPKVDEKKPDPTSTKKPGPTGPVTISLSDDAAKKMQGASWIGVGDKPGDTTKLYGEKVPTSIKAIPVKEGETEKKGYEKIQHNGSEYWVSNKDGGTYGSWKQAFVTNYGGLKEGDTSSKEDPTPKPVVKTPVAAPITNDKSVPKPPTTGAPVASAVTAIAAGSDATVEKPKGPATPPPPPPPPTVEAKATPDAGADASKAPPVATSDAGTTATPVDASTGASDAAPIDATPK